MPVITFDSSPLNKEQKRQLISELTETASRITNIPKQAFVVYLREYDRDNIGTGGVLLSEKVPQ
ncbi:tautomerase family protein [Synergistaceae bacterium OttesenSCG-928-I11]|nr:tautomerase family protein [Synergistaceae bacterium OttesenSCG-928-I11]